MTAQLIKKLNNFFIYFGSTKSIYSTCNFEERICDTLKNEDFEYDKVLFYNCSYNINIH